MMPDRRRTLLLSVLASLVFWLFVDAVSRLDEYSDGFLAPIPNWKRLLLVAVVAGVLYATARAIRSISTRRWTRRVLWLVALSGTFVGTRVWLDAVAEAYSPYDRERPHMPLRLTKPTLAGTVWWNIGGGECSDIHYDVLTFETDTRVRRETRHHLFGGYSLVLHGLIGVWPDGEYRHVGIVRGGAIYWDNGDVERIERVGDGLRLTWSPDLMDHY